MHRLDRSAAGGVPSKFNVTRHVQQYRGRPYIRVLWYHYGWGSRLAVAIDAVISRLLLTTTGAGFSISA